jgi:uncharacterized protein with HEPN domain
LQGKNRFGYEERSKAKNRRKYFAGGNIRMKREYIDYLNDIVEAIEKIRLFTKDFSYARFSKDEKTQMAVVRCLEIIGEAVKNIPLSVRQKHPKVPWKDMAGMRDKLIHEYFGVNLTVVWQTITVELPPLEKVFLKICNACK